MNKKGLLIGISITGFVALTCAFPVYSLVAAFSLPPIYEDTFLGEFKYKVERLKEAEGKKIVFVGGSSLAFGVRSDLIEQELPDYAPVNMGMYASLGSEAMLDFARVNVKQGDIYIISPEQHEQTLSMYFSAESMWQAFDGAYGLYHHLSFSDKEKMIPALASFAIEKSKMNGYVYEGEGVYKRSSFNEYGDIESDLPLYNRMAGGYDLNTPIYFDVYMIEDEFIDKMNDFASFAKSKGASVYYQFGPNNSRAVDTLFSVDDYYTWLNMQLDFEILGNPNDSIMEAGYFYDTNFHLNNSGAIANTKRVVDEIKTALKDSSETHIEVPDAPAIPEKEIIEGDDSHEAYFTYEDIDGGCKITSMLSSFEGDSIIVPATHDGKQVLYFEATVFQNSKLKEVTIQRNIETLLDHSFSGSQITRINLENVSPSSVLVGKNLLYGCGARIYVPSIAVSSYVSDYNWSAYADKISAK